MASSCMTFLLPGRRTLSEHLPAEAVKVPFSTVQRSRHLRGIAHHYASFKSLQDPIELPEVDILGFQIYLSWLISGHIKSVMPCLPTGGGLLLRDCVDLMFAHIVGAQFDEADFQDQVIDEMIQVLSATQTPDLQVMEILFLEKGASAMLKQFVVDRMFAVEKKMLGMLRGLMDGLADVKDVEVGCQYHVHDEGKCYRERSVKPGGREGEERHQNRDEEERRDKGCSSAFPKSSSTTGTIVGEYFGLVEWSHEGHGFEGSAPPLLYDKPLPPIPPLMCGNRPDSFSSIEGSQIDMPPGRYLESFNDHQTVQCTSTQQLVQECLDRLPSENKLDFPAWIQQCSDEENSTSTSLISECLQRLLPALEGCPKNSPVDLYSPHINSTSIVHRPELSPGNEEQPIPLAPSPVLQRRPSHLTSHTLPSTPITQHVPRKPAPLRGSDWLTQYDRVNMMSKNSPATISAKRSRKSRFVELLRNDSRVEMRAMR